MSKTKPENPPAFPVISGSSTQEVSYIQIGMSLRDYFAAKAMAALITVSVGQARSQIHNTSDGAELAYNWADAMLLERSKTND